MSKYDLQERNAMQLAEIGFTKRFVLKVRDGFCVIQYLVSETHSDDEHVGTIVTKRGQHKEYRLETALKLCRGWGVLHVRVDMEDWDIPMLWGDD